MSLDWSVFIIPFSSLSAQQCIESVYFFFQSKRLGALNKFKSKDRSLLIATDVASRGLDIPHVDVVINFDIPTHSKVKKFASLNSKILVLFVLCESLKPWLSVRFCLYDSLVTSHERCPFSHVRQCFFNYRIIFIELDEQQELVAQDAPSLLSHSEFKFVVTGV